MDPIKAFEEENRKSIAGYRQDTAWQKASLDWLTRALEQRYVYNFKWLGRPIIQLPTDMVAFQEIVWNVRPDLIIEMGIAHGGSLVLSASMLAMLDYCDASEKGESLDPRKPKRRVLGVDVDIRSHNRAAIESHPMASRIDMIEGSSITEETIAKVRKAAEGYSRVLVCLDSNHTHDHVLAELRAYAPLVTKDSYCLTFDSIVEDMPEGLYSNRPWGIGNNPKTAIRAYLAEIESQKLTGVDGQPLRFENDQAMEDKLMMTVAPEGYLKRV
ncbi:MAG TPA: cephalosporin hydroxylase [Rhodospirillaceae bacterium]|nr:MAG: cephalosporin hydroxylase [Alphaproteobacteria bacterium GWF2_58_20]HAU28751.1 cephalosporin hydroxylase [Rhodospirillaceae bacterium]